MNVDIEMKIIPRYSNLNEIWRQDDLLFMSSTEIANLKTNNSNKSDSYIKYSERDSVLLNILSMSLFGISSFQIKLLTINFPITYNPNNQMMLRIIGMFLCVNVYFKMYNLEFPKFSEIIEKNWLFVRVVTWYCAFTLFIIGMDFFRFSTMVCFSTSSPVFVMIFSVLILGEEFRIRYLYGLIICLIGSFMIILNETGSTGSIKNDKDKEDVNRIFIGFIIGISHTIFLAINQISMKKLVNSGMAPDIQIYFISIFDFILALFCSIFFKGLENIVLDLKLSTLCITNGFFFYTASKIGQISVKNIDLIKLTTVAYLSTIQAFFLGAIFLHDKVGLTDIIGSLLVLSYNIYNAYFPSE